MNERHAAHFSTGYLARIAVLGAIARVVMLLQFPLPIFPSFLKFDFSDLVPLIGSLAMGPLAGVLIELVKCLLHLVGGATSAGVGSLANFLVGSAFVWTVGMCYKQRRTIRGALLGMAIGALVMTAVGGAVNYFIVLPLYAVVLNYPTDAVIAAAAKLVPAIRDKFTLILFAFSPFNLLKAVTISALTLPLYKKLSPLLK